MASFLQSWWYATSTTTTTTTTPNAPTLEVTSSKLQVDAPLVSVSIIPPDDSDTASDFDDDLPPAFPALNSIQRSSSFPSMPNISKKAKTQSDAELMPPPSFTSDPSASKSTTIRVPYQIPTAGLSLIPSSTNSHIPLLATLRTPNVGNASSLRAPQSSTLQLPPSTTRPPPVSSKKRAKVALAPGHSPLDWAALKASGADLRGTTTLLRIPPSMLKLHNKRHDAWSVFNGKVYNITPYLAFHPGGEKELLRVAGRDGTKLFASTHAWVNVDFMLDECLVGILVSEPDAVDSD